MHAVSIMYLRGNKRLQMNWTPRAKETLLRKLREGVKEIEFGQKDLWHFVKFYLHLEISRKMLNIRSFFCSLGSDQNNLRPQCWERGKYESARL